MKLTFGDLNYGDLFIFFPEDGDNAGHGGYLGAHNIFVRLREECDSNGMQINSARYHGEYLRYGPKSHMPDSMKVIKVNL